MPSFFQDLRYAFRQMRKAPGFTLTAVLSLALGIGATTAVFSIVYVVLIHPYPFRDWERLVTLSFRGKDGNIDCCLGLTGSQLQRLRSAKPIEDILGIHYTELATTGGDLPENVNAIYWTHNAVDYFGVPPALGRGFLPSDAPDGQDPQPVAIISYLFWQRHFGGNRDILRQQIDLDNIRYQIAGVQSPLTNWGEADVYLPLKLSSDPTVRLNTSIRLRPGVSTEAASAELQPILEEFARETPANFPSVFQTHIQPLSLGIREGLGPTMRLLFGAVSLLLLIGCLNVSILLMARGTKRQYELAVRAALGAARRRVVRQLLTESLSLAIIGEALGIGLAYLGQRVLIRELPSALTVRQASIQINLPVLLFSMALTLLTVIGFGLLPAVQFSRQGLRHVMQLGVQRIAGGWGRHTRNALIAGQIALSLVLLAVAATSIRAFLRLMHTNLGYDPHHAAVFFIPLHENSYNTWEERAAYYDRLERTVASTPDVISASIGAAGAVPPNNGRNAPFEIHGQNLLGDQQVRANFVSPDYFGVLHIPLLQGRFWDRTETLRAAPVAVINETMAKQYWPTGDATGKQIRLPKLTANPPRLITGPASDQWVEIIGVVGDALNDGLRDPVKPAVYLPYTFMMPMYAQVIVKTRPNPLSVYRTLRAQIHTVDSSQQTEREATTLEDWISLEDDWQREHTVATLFGAFSVLALLLAGVGLFSAVSYTVAQRTSEFALRMALGAQRRDVLLQVLLSTVGIVGLGVVAGIGGYLAMSRVVARWAYAPSEAAVVLALVTPLLALVAGLACFLPARRAMSVDPMTALRCE